MSRHRPLYDPEQHRHAAIPITMAYSGCGVRDLSYTATLHDDKLYVLARIGIAEVCFGRPCSGEIMYREVGGRQIRTVNVTNARRPTVTNSSWVAVGDLMSHPTAKTVSPIIDLCYRINGDKQGIRDRIDAWRAKLANRYGPTPAPEPTPVSDPTPIGHPRGKASRTPTPPVSEAFKLRLQQNRNRTD